MRARRLRYAALAVGTAWACMWVAFEAAEGIAGGQFSETLLFLCMMFGAVAVACKWSGIGAALLIAEGFAAIVMFAPGWTRHFRLAQFLALFVMMPLPPLAAGLLLLLSRSVPSGSAVNPRQVDV